MKIFLVWTAIGMALLGLSTSQVLRPQVAAPLSAIVHILSIDAEGELIHCSGFFVDQTGLVVTARHCIGEEADAPIAVNTTLAHLVNESETLALVATDVSEAHVFTIRDEAPAIGSGVLDFGYVGEYGLVTLIHHVAGYYTLPLLHRLTFLDVHSDLVLDAPLIGGMSGGPSIDEQGYVVGVNEASNENNSVLCGVAEIHALMPR